MHLLRISWEKKQSSKFINAIEFAETCLNVKKHRISANDTITRWSHFDTRSVSIFPRNTFLHTAYSNAFSSQRFKWNSFFFYIAGISLSDQRCDKNPFPFMTYQMSIFIKQGIYVQMNGMECVERIYIENKIILEIRQKIQKKNCERREKMHGKMVSSQTRNINKSDSTLNLRLPPWSLLISPKRKSNLLQSSLDTH